MELINMPSIKSICEDIDNWMKWVKESHPRSYKRSYKIAIEQIGKRIEEMKASEEALPFSEDMKIKKFREQDPPNDY